MVPRQADGSTEHEAWDPFSHVSFRPASGPRSGTAGRARARRGGRGRAGAAERGGAGAAFRGARLLPPGRRLRRAKPRAGICAPGSGSQRPGSPCPATSPPSPAGGTGPAPLRHRRLRPLRCCSPRRPRRAAAAAPGDGAGAGGGCAPLLALQAGPRDLRPLACFPPALSLRRRQGLVLLSLPVSEINWLKPKEGSAVGLWRGRGGPGTIPAKHSATHPVPGPAGHGEILHQQQVWVCWNCRERYPAINPTTVGQLNVGQSPHLHGWIFLCRARAGVKYQPSHMLQNGFNPVGFQWHC